MIIYLFTFYLFDDIEKNIEITHENQSATSNAILTKMLVQIERLYFLFAFWELSMMIIMIEKHQKQLFYSSKTSFFGHWSQEHCYFWKKCSFWRHIYVSYNN